MKTAIANTTAIILLFALWCLFDFLVVTSSGYPGNAHRGDWLIWIAPVTIVLLNIYIFRHRALIVQFLLAIAASAVSLVVLLCTILYLGIQFHFFIGGKL
jgi:putative effector of murein hydrolase